MNWVEDLRSCLQQWLPFGKAHLEEQGWDYEDIEALAWPIHDELEKLSKENIAALTRAFPALSEDMMEFFAAYGAGKVLIPNSFESGNAEDGPRQYTLFTPAEAIKRQKSALMQLDRDQSSVLESSFAICHGPDTGHTSGRDCVAALAQHRLLVSSFLPFFGPDDVYDFFYVIQTGPWKGGISRWYHDYPICELLSDPPPHRDLRAFGKHVVATAFQGHPLI